MNDRNFPFLNGAGDVSCRAFSFIQAVDRAFGIGLDQILLENISYDLNFLTDSTNNMSWDAWVALSNPIHELLKADPTLLKEVSLHLLNSDVLTSVRGMASSLSSPAELYLLSVMYVAPLSFPFPDYEFQAIGPSQFRATVSLPKGVDPGKATFAIATGALKYIPLLIGQPASEVKVLECGDRQCGFEVTAAHWHKTRADRESEDESALMVHEIKLQHRQLSKAYTRISQTEVLFRRMFDAMPLIAAAHDGGELKLSNSRAKNIFDSRSHLMECVIESERDTLRRFLSTNESNPTRFCLQTDHGEVQILATNLSDPDFRTAGLSIFLALDVTEHVELQKRVSASERMASLGTMAAGMAHEINNPMTSVIANLELAILQIQANLSPIPNNLSSIQDTLKDALTGATRVSSIVSEMNAFSRERDISVTSVNVLEVLKTSLRLAATSFRHGVTIQEEFSQIGRATAAGHQLGQVFVNLLNNAAFACDTNGVVTVRLFESQNHVVIEINDTGSGMPAWLLSRIFEPFYTTKTTEGTGLGLTISKSLLDEMNGHIEVESEVGLGTTFRVLVPREQSFEDVPAPTPKHRATFPVVSGLNILVIDDEIILHRTLARYLGPTNDLVAVESGTDALSILQHRTPDVILCDLMMPGMTGIEVYHRIRDSFPELIDKVLFVTGGSTSSEFEKFVQEHREHTLLKPFTMKALNQRIIRITAAS